MLPFLLGCLQPPDVAALPDLEPVGPADVSASASPPGVLLIVLDDLGYGDTSIPAISEAIQEHDADWQPDIQTPSLTAFSEEGVSLTAFRSDAPVCAPTRAALMTGLQPHAAGFWSANTGWFGAENQLGVRPGLVLLPELLSEAGVSTAMVGKWHLGEHSAPWDPAGGDGGCLPADTPDARGFDSVFGFLSATHDYSIDDTCNELLEGGAGIGLSSPGGGDCPYTGQHTTEVFTDKAIEQLDALSSGADPWFLYVAYNAPHSPVDDGANWIREAAGSDHPDAEKYAAMAAECEGADNRDPQKGGDDFCLLVSHLDLHLGRLLAAAPEDALVIVMSDNGGMEGSGASNAHFRGTKGNVFNGGTVVPMMVRGPGFPADMALGVGLTSAELFPTILDFAGVQPPEAQQAADFPASCDEALELEAVPIVSESRLPLLRDGELGCRDEIFQENTGQAALVVQDEETGENWKLLADLARTIEGETVPICEPKWRLYDLQTDPAESDSLFDDEPELADALMDRFSAHLTGLPYSHEAIAWQTCCFALGGEDCQEQCGDCTDGE